MQIVSTNKNDAAPFEEKVLTHQDQKTRCNIRFNLEKPDKRVFSYAGGTVLTSSSPHLLIKTVNTDSLTISVALFPILNSRNFEQNFLMSYIESTYLCMLFTRNFFFFLAFTKGDQVSVFVDRKKETARRTSNNFVDIMQCFKMLSSFLTKEDIKKVIPKSERFVCLMHDRIVQT